MLWERQVGMKGPEKWQYCKVVGGSKMIRLPPTSISLSEADIEFNLRQADIYYGLLRQGYKKSDIARYLDDYRKAQAEASGQSSTDFNLSVPTTFELTCRRPLGPSLDEGTCNQEPKKQANSFGNLQTSSKHGSKVSSDGYDFGKQEDSADTPNDQNERSPSPESSVPIMQVNKHAPRKSSLLRFSRGISPERPPLHPEDEDDCGIGSSSNFTATKSYRRRSLTYSYKTSDPEESDAELSLQTLLAGRMDRMSLGSSSQQSDDMAESSMPFVLPPAFTATSRSYTFGNDNFANDQPDSQPSEMPPGPPPSTESGTPRHSSSLLGQAGSSTSLPSSPPVLNASPIETPSTVQAASTSSELPATPTPVRNAASFPRTEPRYYRHQYLDGNAFSIYNDSLPASSQPQTPADLSRGPFVTERDAAYTAPPGMVRTGPSNVYDLDGSRWERNVGEQSPTARAISLRERRNRELQRSVRAEGIRLQRLRLRDEAMFTQGHATTNHIGGEDGGNDEGTRATAEMFQDAWRHDHDADRVGEENFEMEVGPTRPRAMRVVSGNARIDG
ncbi:hypothetical protein LTR92_006674 [Exophiala xenobiotica]|nr:hypothetical protein LTR92_006674 [Exophiala xenobiotica]KAK5435794.1 hypothetical protein LTR18_009796 [Exophiala xenobiotica]